MSSLVSVIMPFKNAERYFGEAIESVLSQSHRPLELLLCDDHPADRSSEIARWYADRYPDVVRHLTYPGSGRRGASAARNLGIAEARGDLIAFLDADDVWLPDHLEADLRLLDSAPDAELVCGQAVAWYSWNSPGSFDVALPLPYPHGTLVRPPSMLASVLERGVFSTPTCNLLVRTSAIADAVRFEDSFEWLYEDQVFLARLYLSRASVVSGNRTALYRKHSQSSTARAFRSGLYNPARPHESRRLYLRHLLRLLNAFPLPDSKDHAMIRREVLRQLAPYRTLRYRLTARPMIVLRATLPTRTRAQLGRARRWLGLTGRRFRKARRAEGQNRRTSPSQRRASAFRKYVAENRRNLGQRVVTVDHDLGARLTRPALMVTDRFEVGGEAAGPGLSDLVSGSVDTLLLAPEVFEGRMTAAHIEAVFDEASRVIRLGGALLAAAAVGGAPGQLSALHDGVGGTIVQAVVDRFGVGNVEFELRPVAGSDGPDSTSDLLFVRILVPLLRPPAGASPDSVRPQVRLAPPGVHPTGPL